MLEDVGRCLLQNPHDLHHRIAAQLRGVHRLVDAPLQRDPGRRQARVPAVAPGHQRAGQGLLRGGAVHQQAQLVQAVLQRAGQLLAVQSAALHAAKRRHQLGANAVMHLAQQVFTLMGAGGVLRAFTQQHIAFVELGGAQIDGAL